MSHPMPVPRRGNLCLNRREGESVEILLPGGETIKVSVYELKNREVKLAFEADPGISILRSEAVKRSTERLPAALRPE